LPGKSGLANLARAGENLDEATRLAQARSEKVAEGADNRRFHDLLNCLSNFTQGNEESNPRLRSAAGAFTSRGKG
jgi:hypothetical protein